MSMLSKSVGLAGAGLAALLLTGAATSALAQSALPKSLAHGRDLGPVPASVQLHATVHLKLPDEKAFDAAVQSRYDPKSPNYHRWMTDAELAAFAPDPQDVKAVRRALVNAGLTVTDITNNGSEIDVSGGSRAMQLAFGAQMHAVSIGGTTTFASVSGLRLNGELAQRVQTVSGLSGVRYEPMLRFPVDEHGKRLKRVPADDPSPLDSFSANCFSNQPEKVITDGTNTTDIAPVAGYAFTFQGTSTSCAYTPTQVLQHYGIDQLHAAGADGTGQTIVITDAYGSPTALQDANTFFAATGVAPFTKDNFKILYPHGKPTTVNYSWAGETALDIEWAHVVAPGAKIILVVSVDNNASLDQALKFAISRKLGNVITNSWGFAEHYADADYTNAYDRVMKHAAAKGISVGFSTGDDGDNGDAAQPASFPASSAWVTAVGGTSLGVLTSSGPVETGWGNNRAQLGYDNQPLIPPNTQGFYWGGGGGVSTLVPKPHWEKSLQGAFRSTPDLSMMADPYTGAIMVSPDGQGGSSFGSVGGTSLASPLFAGLWAIADQISGCDSNVQNCTPGSSLGLAAVLAPKMAKAGALVDVGPNGATQLQATFTTSSGASSATGLQIAGADGDVGSVSVLRLRNLDNNGYSVLTFGTDSTLHVASGWDDVTGYGVPNAPALKTWVQSLSSGSGS